MSLNTHAVDIRQPLLSRPHIVTSSPPIRVPLPNNQRSSTSREMRSPAASSFASSPFAPDSFTVPESGTSLKNRSTTKHSQSRHMSLSQKISRSFARSFFGQLDEDEIDEEHEPPILEMIEAVADSYPISGQHISGLLSFNCLNDLLNDSHDRAIVSADNRRPLRYNELRAFISNVNLAQFGIFANTCVALLLPNGPELSVAVVALVARCTCFPVNPQNTYGEILADMMSVNTQAMIVQEGQNNEHLIRVAEEMKIPLISLRMDVDQCGIFDLVLHERSPRADVEQITSEEHWTPRNGLGLKLHTSGTSGKKKIVGYTLETIIVGAVCILISWKLQRTDVNLNMMPLFHIGGIARNLFAVLLSGSAVICALGFDASFFWDIVEQQRPTWYYAGPTMHQMLVQEARTRGLARCQSALRIRFIANAAGALLPTVAQDMKTVFNCAILPGYGMTECMPVSSPPPDYQLDRPGSSGRAVGPEMDVFDDKGDPVPIGAVGNIVVRGPPLFTGYEGQDSSCNFFPGGWFNTGDLGYFDCDRWIYITGRSKEVINRGGEIISPFEVEECLQEHPRIQNVLCFAAPHDTLEDTIGVAVVCLPNLPRPDLAELTRFVSSKLHPSKWPFVLVYLTDLPRTLGTNKMQRIGFASRCKMKTFNDSMSNLQRTFVAVCPSPGADLKTFIECCSLPFDMCEVEKKLLECEGVTVGCVISMKYRGQPNSIIAYVSPETVDIIKIKQQLNAQLDDYYQPSVIMALPCLPMTNNGSGNIDVSALPNPSCESDEDYLAPRNVIEEEIHKLFQSTLGVNENISVSADFFTMGGTSLLAGKLAAALRNSLHVSLSVADIFTNRTIETLALEYTKQQKLGGGLGFAPLKRGENFVTLMRGNSVKNVTPQNASHICNLFITLIPVVFFYPVRKAAIWVAWALLWVCLIEMLSFTTWGPFQARFVGLVLASFIISVGADIVVPWFGIVFKWLVIGRYQVGRYPVHGRYYLKWWLVNQALRVCGRGMFDWNGTLLVLYYRLLGMSVGKNVKLSPKAAFGEFDLLKIGDNVSIDKEVLLRCMCFDRGTLCFKAIEIGSNVSLAQRVQVAPGTKVLQNSCFGPLSSSYDMSSCKPEYRSFNAVTFVSPVWYLRVIFGYPLLAIVWAISNIPVYALMFLMAAQPWHLRELQYLADAMEWFTTPDRVIFYFAIRATRGTIQPCLKLLLCLMIKFLWVGRFKPGPRNDPRSLDVFNCWLMGSLMQGGNFCGVSDLFGKHYEMTSWLYRLFGAKIGQRVYWPGSGFEMVEYDLLEVGNDVVFGSRSVLQPRDAHESLAIKIGDSANVSDRCFLLGGTTVEACAVLGSGSLGHKHSLFKRGSVSVGSVNGKAVELIPFNSRALCDWSSFGKAFYGKHARYFVFPESCVILYNFLIEVFVSCVHAAPILASIFAAQFLVLHTDWLNAIGNLDLLYLLVVVGSFCVIYPVSVFLCLFLDWCAKWILIGRRKPGSYSWQESSYCQRWQVCLSFGSIRRSGAGVSGMLDFFRGTEWLVWWFRSLGATIGKRVCLYPNGGDPMMTEPELVKIEDFVCVDDACLIGHMNTKGAFILQSTTLGQGSTMRSMARLLAGCQMEQEATMLEHTLVMAGDIVSAGTTLQGWPSHSAPIES